jgi:hypothetical protein
MARLRILYRIRVDFLVRIQKRFKSYYIYKSVHGVRLLDLGIGSIG